MRRITTAITAAALSISMALSLNAGTAQALTAGYDSAYQFESAFLSLKASDSGTFSVFFANTGSTSWVAGSSSQVNLGICAADKVTCNVTSAQASWGVNWLSSTAYATHTKSVVSPGDFSAFTYNVKVPAGTAAGTYRFNGDLVRSATGDRIHPEGYFQDGTVTTGAPPPGGGVLSVTPAYSANEDNEVSTTVPGNGQHTYTFTTTLTGTLTFATMTSANIARVADGQYGFCDTNQDSKADGVGSSTALITAINGSSISPSNIVINQAIPSTGTMTVTIDSQQRNTRVRLIGWQDLNGNAQIDLTGPGDVNCDNATQAQNNTTVDGAMIVSGRKFWFGPQGQFGAQGGTNCPGGASGLFVFRHDSTNQVFSAGTTIDTSLRYNYDSNDILKVLGTQVTLATFKSELTPSNSDTTHADVIDIAYDPNPAGISTFNICINRGADAPTNLAAAVGNFDNDSTGRTDDVRLTFTSPAVNTVLSFNIQRANLGSTVTASGTNCTPDGSPNPSAAPQATTGASAPPSGPAPSDGTQGIPANASFTTVGGTSTPGNSETATFVNSDLSNGGYCFRVQVTNPNTGVNSYSNYVPVNITGVPSTEAAPISTVANLTNSSGFANTLDSGDKIIIDFNKQMSVASNATIRVTDSDCGTASSAGPATCSGGNTNTVADIICGTNATCELKTVSGRPTNGQLEVTMTGNPTVVAAGSVAGATYPVVVTDSIGVTDLFGNAWNLTEPPTCTASSLATCNDRAFGPGDPDLNN